MSEVVSVLERIEGVLLTERNSAKGSFRDGLQRALLVIEEERQDALEAANPPSPNP